MVNASSGYASLASSSASVEQAAWATSLPNDPYAPSLSHLNPDILPHGYQVLQDHKHATFLPQLEQSPNDDRQYRLIRLANGLECTLVSDSNSDKAAAGISVRVGHLSDPENAQGMAHFCEHLLFMGTEKVRIANYYQSERCN